MMDALISGLEQSLVGFTYVSSLWSLSKCTLKMLRFRLWNYNSFNDNKQGDMWNGENFSLFSRDSKSHGTSASEDMNVRQVNENLDDGGRVLRAIVRHTRQRRRAYQRNSIMTSTRGASPLSGPLHRQRSLRSHHPDRLNLPFLVWNIVLLVPIPRFSSPPC